jgi:putative addiction module killer protein
MIEIRQTNEFASWLRAVRDPIAKAKITSRIERMRKGNFGDWKQVEPGVSELRIDQGPGYRVYFTQRGNTVILILCGGDKTTQDADIARAVEMVEDL